MGFCTRRHFLLSICTLQLLLTIQRQVFDFLGYMWAPILTNFFHILFVIFGFFGAYQYRIKYLVTYSIWNVIWLGWNIFVICFYTNIGILNRDTSDILNLGTGSVSWFEVNGYGCRASYSTNNTLEIDVFKPPRPEQVDGCLLDYYIVEVIQAGLQCLLAILGLIGAFCIERIFMEEDDSSTRSGTLKKSKYRQSLYSVEFGPPVDTIRSRSRDALNNAPETLSPKPMTPRRIKRRSVMNRGTSSRTSSQSRRSHRSHRSSRRKIHQSPVTKLLEQQQNGMSSKNLPSFSRGGPIASTSTSHLTESNLKSLDYGPMPSTSAVRTASDIVRHSPDPIYYNMTHNVSSPLPQDTASWSPSPPPVGPYQAPTHQGHTNPTYQHSTPNLSHSPEPMDEPYGNRPPSVRSSYSNFHGARPLSSYNPNSGAKENVFLGLTQQAQQQQQQQQQQPQMINNNPPPIHSKSEPHPLPVTHKHEPFRPTQPQPQHQPQQQQQQQQQQQHHQPKPAAAMPPPTHPKPYAHVQPTQAQMPPPPQSSSPYQHLPQLPLKTRAAVANSRESMNSLAFIQSGPPAYNLNYHTPPDSETTM